MRDSSDDFFSQHTTSAPVASSSLRSRRSGGSSGRQPPPPAPRSGGTMSGRRGPPPPPPKASLSLGTSSGASHYKTASQPPAPPHRPSAAAGNGSSASYYGTTTAAAPAVAAAAPSFYAAPTNDMTTNSFYGAPAPAAVPTDSSSSDWYQPSVSTTSQQQPQAPPSFQPQQQQQQPQGASLQQPNVMNPYNNANTSSLEGAMDTNGGVAIPAQQKATKRSSSFGLSSMFSGSGAESKTVVPPAAPSSSGSYYTPYDPMEFANDPPLLEELGIVTDNIWFKTKAVLFPLVKFQKASDKYNSVAEVVNDNDLAGPLAFALALGGELLLSGKVHFGYIYGFGLFGCLSMTLILNLMSPVDAISVWTVTSILGYSLLPVNILALVKLVLLGYLETFGRILALLTIAWCTVASTRLLEQGCGMRDQRYLVAYPIALLYSAFVMITIF